MQDHRVQVTTQEDSTLKIESLDLDTDAEENLDEELLSKW